jgi:hypothetical protein
MRIDIDYPDFLYLEEGRPTVFAANGSHGMWAQEGYYLFRFVTFIYPYKGLTAIATFGRNTILFCCAKSCLYLGKATLQLITIEM